MSEQTRGHADLAREAIFSANGDKEQGKLIFLVQPTRIGNTRYQVVVG